jgi:hypothetical protein
MFFFQMLYVPAEPTAIFYCLIWDSLNLESQVLVFISPGNRVAQLYPRTLGSLFVASYDSQGYGGGILTRLHTTPRHIEESVPVDYSRIVHTKLKADCFQASHSLWLGSSAGSPDTQ